MRRIFAVLAMGLVLAGCQGQVAPVPQFATRSTAPPEAAPQTLRAMARRPGEPFGPSPGASCGRRQAMAPNGLQGRTIRVESLSDIVLQPGEVVLTFDDGPIKTKTVRVLDTLDRYGVKATFFMVGRMARSYPALVREVAARGHTLGSHTGSHPDLTRRSLKSALLEIVRGERAVREALTSTGQAAAPFFRFPYLADTKALRAAMARRGVVIIGVDIDSRDYHRVSAERVKSYTLKRLRARGKGIILFHDIHARTVAMLPEFLAALKAEGYKVVHLAPAGTDPDAPCATPTF